jgi:hypothetical protein
VTRRRRSKMPAVIDACCVIDLLASGQVEAILQSNGLAWHLPVAVRAETQFVRRYDPALPGRFKVEPVDFSPHLSSGLLTMCEPIDVQEQTLFVQFASRFRSDGEAMCMAIAKSRGWSIATDDRKAIRVARQSGLTVLSCPELVKMWAAATRSDRAVIVQVLNDIQVLAQFRPNTSMPHAAWWQQQLASP